MTRQEFLEQLVDHSNYFCNSDDHSAWEKTLNQIKTEFHNEVNIDFLHDFLYGNGFKGSISIWRYEKNSGNKLYFNIGCRRPSSLYFWDDIGRYVSDVVYVFCFRCVIEKFYISEDGRFWDEQHTLRFETEEELFDYLLTVEYDYNPVIPEKTYEMLRHFGWYEGRRIDTFELEQELKKHSITLSQTQLDVIREFSGIALNFSAGSWNQEFYTIEEMIERIRENDLDFESEVYDSHSKILLGKNVFEFGSSDMEHFSLSGDGRIFIGSVLVGRTVLEYIYDYLKDIPDNVRWL